MPGIEAREEGHEGQGAGEGEGEIEDERQSCTGTPQDEEAGGTEGEGEQGDKADTEEEGGAEGGPPAPHRASVLCVMWWKGRGKKDEDWRQVREGGR